VDGIFTDFSTTARVALKEWLKTSAPK
jgi:hypothetical protein